ncbi:polyisoprenoid-binding protein YceI [Pontibacter aydingkolensis]|uniref:YceI family protein n=1 Tax=Pontibacter aydingkolensis TaxID=1911536 RepID=A0ABS7CY61_9BACT|nr:YceI family protein [Pontibacter aydingkolensis]MBW7468757.1 YceI family protein [Pontibacter aydingkolensis]
MRKHSILLSALALATLLTTTAATQENLTVNDKVTVAAASTLRVNTESSAMKWNAKKVGGEHYGKINISEGALQVNGNKLTGGNFVIDMTTIVVEDITNLGSNKKLTDHLKSDDFFSVEKYNTSSFKITKAAPIAKAKAGEANYRITGDLTIKGITQPISFPATVKIAGKAAEAEAKIEVDRTQYDIKYRSGLIGTAADKIINDTFTLDIKLVADTANQTVSGK